MDTNKEIGGVQFFGAFVTTKKFKLSHTFPFFKKKEKKLSYSPARECTHTHFWLHSIKLVNKIRFFLVKISSQDDKRHAHELINSPEFQSKHTKHTANTHPLLSPATTNAFVQLLSKYFSTAH